MLHRKKKAKITPSLDLSRTRNMSLGSYFARQGNGFRLATSYISAMSII